MASPTETVLCLNAGSSSLKYAAFVVTPAGALTRLCSSVLEGFSAETADDCFSEVFETLERTGVQPTLVGHRVVHGGMHYSEPQRMDATVLTQLQALVPLAPLHLPLALAGIEVVQQRLPMIAQVACFDTAFHHGMPELACRYTFPPPFHEQGVRRYGFHGLSYESLLESIGHPPPERIVAAHLGSGMSLAAIKHGRCVDTTMGFTPSGGVMMGTRTGDLDPGLLLYLMRVKGLGPDELEQLVDHRSGLRGLAGTSDMKALIARSATDPSARLAITMLAYSIRKTIGAYAAVLGGIDLLVFTGGVGEHAPPVRAAACDGLDVIGIRIDPERNEENAGAIQATDSRCGVLVIPTDEAQVIAAHTWRVTRQVP